MSLSTVKTVATRFLKSAKPGVLALKGAWGVGKTHAWNNLVLQCKDDISFPSYCYVSLFGISSITELRTAVFTKTQSVKRLGEKIDAEAINREWLDIIRDQGKRLYRLSSRVLNELPYGRNITVALESLAPHLIRDTVVCLDDFERMATGSGLIKPEEVLGRQCNFFSVNSSRAI